MTPAHPAESTSDGPQEGTQTAVSTSQTTGPTTATPPTDNDGAALLDRVQAALNRYVILPSDHAVDATVLWIAATHAQPAWAHAPRLVIRAPEKRCGKSRLLDVVEALCWNAFITVNSSPAAVYRSITADPPTLLVDEADTMFGPKADGNEDLRGLLNAGHQRNRPAKRYDAASNRVESIPTFAMAALAGIGVMPDTIEDRAVIVRMRRRAPGETVSPYRHKRDRPRLQRLATELHVWLRANLAVLEQAEPLMPVEDRAADTWEPLFAVAELAGDNWSDRARAAVIALQAETEDTDDTSDRVRLLLDTRRAFSDRDAIPTAYLLERLNADPEAPWSEYGPLGLNARRLALLLAQYGIRSHTIRFIPGGQAKGFLRADFLDAWSRYCPPELALDSAGHVPERGGTRTTRTNLIPAGQSGTGHDPGTGCLVPGTGLDVPGTGQPVPDHQPVPPLTRENEGGTGGTSHPPFQDMPPALRVVGGSR